MRLFTTAAAFAAFATGAAAHSGHLAPQDGHAHGWPIALVACAFCAALAYGAFRRK